MSNVNVKAELVTGYLASIENLIKKYPIQEQNRAYFESFARNAKVGTITHRIRTKGGLTDMAKGTKVLAIRDPGRSDYHVWGRTDGDSLCTVVGPESVRFD